MRTIDWVDGAIEIIDQTVLPERLVTRRLSTVGELIEAIQSLAVRGAPALGVAGALGVALVAAGDRVSEGETAGDRVSEGETAGDGVAAGDRTAGDRVSEGGTAGDGVAEAVRRIAAARPTAVNLAAGVRRAAAHLAAGPAAVLAEALRLRDEEIASSAAMAARGADWVTASCGAAPRILTHCNTGGLATVTGGTALGVVLELHRRDRLGGVIASETRPLLQGARLTAWELGQAGVAYRMAVDGAGPYLMARGEVDAVLVGADRVCANGDVVNKIGTYAHALGAARAGIPFVVVAPESTIDPGTATGDAVPIEDRDPAEVLRFGAATITPPGAGAANPAFDVTPHDLVSAVVTDTRVLTGGRRAPM